MSTNAYNSTTGQLDLVAGTPRSRLNAIQAKAEASLNNQSSSIEPSNIAQYSHTAGSFINYGADKQFAEVTSAIAVGDSIVDGTNVEDKSIGEVLTNLNSALIAFLDVNKATSISTTSYTATSNCYVRIYLANSNMGECYAKIDGHNIKSFTPSSSSQAIRDIVPVKAGQTISVSGGNSALQEVIPFKR